MKHIQPVFKEHEQPQHCCKREVHDHLAPVVRLAAKAQKQVLEYRTLITEATLAAEHDHALDSKLEHMHQTFGAMEREAGALAAAARGLAQATQQLDRYIEEWKADFARLDAMKSGEPETAR